MTPELTARQHTTLYLAHSTLIYVQYSVIFVNENENENHTGTVTCECVTDILCVCSA